MNHTVAIAALSCVLAALPARAADLSFLPRPEAVDEILDTHPIVGAAAANLDAARADALRLRAGPHEVQLSGYLGNRTVNNQGDFTVWDMTISRGIRLGDKAAYDAKAGDIGIAYGGHAMEDARHRTALILLSGWMDWLEAEALAAIDEDEAQSYARERDAIQRRVTQLDAAQRDVDLAEAAYARASAAAVTSRGMAAVARAALQRTFPELALAPAAPIIAAPELPALALDRWFDLILQRSHEVRLAELEADRQQALATRAALERMPDPSIGVRAYSDSAKVETAFALVFSIPLGVAGRSAAADVQAAKARAAVAELARVRREYEQRAHQVVIRTQASLAAWRQSDSARSAAATALERTRRGYELGEFDLTELLLIARQTFDAQRGELGARATAQRAVLQMQIDGHELWILEDHQER